MGNSVEEKKREEELELNRRLEGIFMPRSRERRDIAYGKDRKSGLVRNSNRFVHYTSAEAALRIIGSKRIWMRSTTCMSDYREVQHGFDLLSRWFSNQEKRDRFRAALDACAPGAADEAIDWFNRSLPDIRFKTFIASMSEHDATEDTHGRLSMWRAFGGNTARIALIFEIPWASLGAQELNFMFSPVTYSAEDDVHASIEEVISNISNHCDLLRSLDRQSVVGWVFNMLLVGVTCLKHEGFREEREWRAIYCPSIHRSSLLKSTTIVKDGIPQLVYLLPLDQAVSPALADLDFARLFSRLIIGPSPYPMAMAQAFISALSEAGVQDPENRVSASNIPIRS